MGRYQELNTIAQGSHGIVVRAKDATTGRVVAIKRPLYYDNEVPLGLIREIKILKELRHANVVELLDVYVSGGQVHLAYELLEMGSLSELLASTQVILDCAVVKGMLQMLLSGVAALHAGFVMHRDLKPDNILVSAEGVLKIADFGLSKRYGDSESVVDTPEVVTYTYRAPELFFGAYRYSPVVDCWSVGAIAVEMWNRAPFFTSDTELDALRSIASIFDLAWPGADTLPHYTSFKTAPAQPAPTTLRALMRSAPQSLVDLVAALLEPNPAQRAAATDALRCLFFEEAPAPQNPQVNQASTG